MCYYRLYIFLGCGHSATSSKPVSVCITKNTRSKRASKATTTESGHDSGVFFADSELDSVPEGGEECTPGPSTPAHTQPNMDAPNLTQHSKIQEPAPGSQVEFQREPCRERHYHPRQTLKVERLCSHCTLNRQKLLEAVNTGNEVKFEDWRWRVKYLPPVPEEARYTERGVGGEVIGSWVKDWKTKGDELINVLRDNVLRDNVLRDNVLRDNVLRDNVLRDNVLGEGARDRGASGVRLSGRSIGSGRRSNELGRLGTKRGMGSS